MNILFLGTGTSTGVPSLCCTCPVCQSDHWKNKRLRSSILIRNGEYHLLIDTSSDLRQQCLANKIARLDAVLYTHHHADHVNGIDELRCFNYFNKTRTPLYASAETLAQLKSSFQYIFSNGKAEGGGVSQVDPIEINGEALELGGLTILPLDVEHGRMMIKSFRVQNVAYLTDCSGIPDKTREALQGLDVLIINALGFNAHPTHFCLSQSLEVIEQLKPKRSYLTHINHQFDHETVNATLPENVELAYDGMEINCGNSI